MEWIKPGTKFDFVAKRKIMLAFSGGVILLGILSMLFQGGLRTGIDFSGGTEVHLQFTEAVAPDRIRGPVDQLGYGEAVVQRIGLADDNEYLVRVPEVPARGESIANVIRDTLTEEFGEGAFIVQAEEVVGPRAGRELRQQGFLALAMSFIGIMIYIGIRFDIKFASGAIAAVLHDTLFIVTIFSLLGKEVTLTVIAAILTIIGYSINDTVVVFDRIRENRRFLRTKTFGDVINLSVNETLPRTVLTSFTVLLVVVVLYLFGGSVLHDFAFTMLIGVIVGTYSSVFVAAPLVLEWHNRGKKPAEKRRKVAA